MAGTTMTHRGINQGCSGPRRTAESGTVFVVDRGQPAHELLALKDYGALLGE